MRILVYGINYAPELTGIGKYSGEMVEWLCKRGHEIHVVTAPPYYPAWCIGEGYSAWRYRREVISSGKVTIYRCPLWVPGNPSGIKRLIHLASFGLSSFPVALFQVFWKPEAVIVIEPSLVCAPSAWMVSKLCGAKSWLHVQDFEVDAAFDLGILIPGRLRTIVMFCERLVMRLFHQVSTISPIMVNRLAHKGVDQDKTTLFPNWVDTENIRPLNKPPSLRAELGIFEDSIVALYSGNMGEKQGLEIVLEAAQHLVSKKQIRFILCGNGSSRSRLKNTYAHLTNVTWLPLQPAEKLNELLNVADIHLLPQRSDAADLVMPSKLTGMLSSGRPVIASARTGTQLAEIVSNCGMVVLPGDVEGLVQALTVLAEDEEKRKLLGIKARTYAEKHMAKSQVLSEFEKILIALVNKHKSLHENSKR